MAQQIICNHAEDLFGSPPHLIKNKGKVKAGKPANLTLLTKLTDKMF